MPPFSIAEFADLVSSALALDDDFHTRFGQRWDVLSSGNGLVGNLNGEQFQPETPITRARRNAFDLSCTRQPSTTTSSFIPPSFSTLPSSPPSLLLPEPEESQARSLSLNFPFASVPSNNNSSYISSASSSTPPVSANINHNQIPTQNNLSKLNFSPGPSTFSRTYPRKPKGIKFNHSEKQKNFKKLNGAPRMLLVPPPSDPAILAAATMSTVDLGANCLSSLGGGGGGGGSTGSKARRASSTGLRLGLGLNGTSMESGWERNAMDAPGSSGRSIAGGVGKLLPRISISGSVLSSSVTAPSSPVSPGTPAQGQGQGPLKLFAKLKRQLSKNSVRPNPASTPSPTTSLFPFPSHENEPEHALPTVRTLHHSQSVSFASPTSPVRSDSDWEFIAASSSAFASTSSLASNSSDGTIGSGRGKKRRGRKRRTKGSRSPPASRSKTQTELQLQSQAQLGEEGDTSPSLYSCESAPRSYIGSSESFFLALEDDKLPHDILRQYQEDREDAQSTSTGSYAPYLPLIIQHERLQQKLKTPISFTAVTEGGGASLLEAKSQSPRSRKASSRGRERKRTLSGTSRGQASISTSTTSRSRKRASNAPLPPLAYPPPAAPPPACPPSPSPPPRRASAPDTRLRNSNSHLHSHSQRRAVSPFSASSVGSRESRDSVDSRGPVTPCTPFFTASEASSIIVAGDGDVRGRGSTSTGSGSVRSSEDASFEDDERAVVGGLTPSEREKQKFSVNSIGPVPVSPRSSYGNGTRRSLSPLQRAASPTPRVCLTRSRSRQTLAVAAGPVSPPPSGPLPPPPPSGGGEEKERQRKERARHSTPTPSLTRAELITSRRGSSLLLHQPSCEWPLHHHPSSIGVNVLSTPESRSFSASASAPASPSSVGGTSEEFGRRASLAEDIQYLSSSSASSELGQLYQRGMTTAFNHDRSSTSENSEYCPEDLTTEEDYLHRRQRQHHLLSRLQGHLPCPSTATTSTCDTSAEAAAALLAANTRANAGIKEKIGFGRQQIGVRRQGQKSGLEWTLCLGTSADSSSSAASASNATHVCASGVTPDSTPVVPAAPAPSYVASHQQSTRKAGLSTNKTSLPSSASRPSSGFLLHSADLSCSPGFRERCKSESAAASMPGSGRRGKEDWTLSLPMPPRVMPEEWAKKMGVQSNGVVENGNVNVRHSAPTPGTDVVITVEDVDDPERLDVDTSLRMSLMRSSMTRDPRIGEIVLCVPRVVSSGSGIEDVVMDNSRARTSIHSSVHEDLYRGDKVERESAEEVEWLVEDPILEQKERVKANAKANLAKLDALSADLARFNDMLRSGHPSSSRSRFRASMPSPPKNLKHARSCGVLEVDEPPPKNAVLRMPSVEVFLKDSDNLRSELDIGDDDEDDRDDWEKEDEEEKGVKRTSTPAQMVFSSMSIPAVSAAVNATRPAVARLSAASMSSIRSSASMTSLSSTTPSPTSPSRIRAPLPFAPFPPPTSFAPSTSGKVRKSEAAAASMNAGSGVSGVLASGLFGSSVNGGGRALGRTLSSSMGRGVSVSASTSTPPTSTVSKPALKLQTSEASSFSIRPRVDRRTSMSSISSNSTTSTATVATPAFPSSVLVPSPLLSHLETPMASSFPSPPLSFPSLANGVVGGRSNLNSKPAKENARPSTTSSETSVSSVGTDETILPSVEQRMRMRMGLLGTGLLGSVESDHEKEGTDEESMCSGIYYSARSSFSSEMR